MYKDVVVGKYYNVHIREVDGNTEMGTMGMHFDPSLFREDSGEREEHAAAQRQNSRPMREAKPMYVGTNGKLYRKYGGGEPSNAHNTRM